MENKAGLRASPALVEFGYFCEESETRGDALGATICAPIPLEDAKGREQHAAVIPTATPSGVTVPHPAPRTTYLFFNMEEAAFIEVAVSRLVCGIPRLE